MKYDSPKKEDLIKIIESGKGKAAISRMYGVSIPVVNRWLREHSIEIRPYHGLKRDDDIGFILERINEIDITKYNIGEIAKKLDLPRQVLKKICKDNGIALTSQFNRWEDDYQKIMNNIDYYKERNEKETLKQISHTDNISIEQLKKAFRECGVDVKLHSYNKSKGELECKQFIHDCGIDCHSILVDRRFEIDCFVPSVNFGLEYCGEFWHSYTPEKNNRMQHRNKWKECEDRGIRLMTIFESEWKTKRLIIESMIKTRLGIIDTKVFARKCNIEEISNSIAKEFHNKNHISGFTKSSINIGLFYNNELISVLSFVKSRFDKRYEWEISRFSTQQNTIVVGGLSKMMNHFIKTRDPNSIMTYADLRFGRGMCYELVGFEFVGLTPPNYFYMKKGSYELESRIKYQKHKLKNMEYYDNAKTEHEIMTGNNYFRIYDCGNAKYVWNKKGAEAP